MTYINNVMIVRHKLLSTLVEKWRKDELIKTIDRIPIELSPRKNRNVLGRCCPYKERAVWRYKTFPLLGFDMTDEEDELTPLSHYAHEALHRPQPTKESVLCVIDEACTSCVQINYEVSNLCRGCVSRACSSNCPKNCISFSPKTGQARIDHSVCVSCGACHKNCPYHAIVYIPVPCEESCPVGAISKDEEGIERIDESKCIYCGACLNACPFGAIFEISQVFDILGAIERKEQVIAIVAPAILGQFKTTREKVYGALKEIGFHDVIEVAQGAMDTVSHEGKELVEKIEGGQAFMTTSCCPSFYELVDKHAPGLKPFVSHSHSPMVYTAIRAREKYPNSKIVFIGPCVAKRKEAKRPNVDVDMVLTFEELGSIFAGMGIDVKEANEYAPEFNAVREAHAFARNGGVKDAVLSYLHANPQYKTFAEELTAEEIAGMDKAAVRKLKTYGKKGKADVQFVEVMACEGGCVTGPSAYNDIVAGRRQLLKEVDKMELTYDKLATQQKQ